MGRSLIIGTVEAAISIEEAKLGRKLPDSFRQWLLEFNGSNLADLHIYPVRDERDTRKTWNSLAHNLHGEWASQLKEFDHTIFAHLLPFADCGFDDYYCFDYSQQPHRDEPPIVRWSGASGLTQAIAESFDEFNRKVASGGLQTG